MNYAPLITEIKGHSLDDGEGIRSVIFFKGCPLSCVWCHNPEAISPYATLSYDEKACSHFGDCIQVCESQAIDIQNPFFIDRDRCTGCGQCVDACASEAITWVGQPFSVDVIVEKIKRYLPFFKSSGGGVTLSGGEATLYMDFCESLLKKLNALDISVTLETSGYFNQKRFFEKMYPYLDQIYFDIKLMDSEQHQRYCGQNNEIILANFKALQQRAQQGGVDLLARVPLIPGITTTASNLEAIANFLTTLGERKLALLPYNPLWQEKTAKIGQCGDYTESNWLSEEALNQCRGYFDDFELVG